MSAAGHLSLMLEAESDEGRAESQDPVERVSDRVNAVVAYVAPTGLRIMAQAAPNRLPAHKQFQDLAIEMKTAKADSLLVHVSSDDAPTLLFAGVKDDLVPILHSRNIETVFAKFNNTSELIELENAGNGFGAMTPKRRPKRW